MSRMAGRVAEGISTRRRLVATAERMFARSGIDGVSLRDITTAAKVNSAAIYYHFGTKHDLIAAIVEERAAESAGYRARWLADLAAMEQVDVRAISEAMVRPTAEIWMNTRWGKHHASFLQAAMDHSRYSQLVTDALDEHSHQYLVFLEAAVPDSSPEELAFRYTTARQLINQAFGPQRRRVGRWVEHLCPGADPSDETYIGRLIDLVSGALAGCPTRGRRVGRNGAAVR
jgi:AcrR family transcriptional regulator